MNENKDNNKAVEHYEQIGVAMTCRSFAEYERMFALDHAVLARGNVLDVAAGASSFTAEACVRGYDVTSVDPQYALRVEQLETSGHMEIELSTSKLTKLASQLDWSYYGNIERHKAGRIYALRQFLAHYGAAANRHRYVGDQLPHLPFADGSFSLILCSHFLFLYEEQFDVAFHEAALLELYRLLRPGGEMRIYPLASLRWKPYEALPQLVSRMEQQGAVCERVPAHLPFIPNSTELLRICRPAETL